MQLFITGTSNGIGKSLAELALQRGYQVTGLSRRNEIEHANFIHKQIDLSDFESLKKISFPKIDEKKVILINNAGTLGEIDYMGGLNEDELISAMSTNVIAPMILLNKFMQTYALQTELEVLIINISSGAGNHPYDGWSEYCCSKAAIEMLTKVLDKEIKERNQNNCRVISVYPGIVETNMQKKIRKSSEDSFSMVQKFVENFENKVNKTPQKSALEIIDVIENTDKYQGLVVDFWQLN